VPSFHPAEHGRLIGDDGQLGRVVGRSGFVSGCGEGCGCQSQPGNAGERQHLGGSGAKQGFHQREQRLHIDPPFYGFTAWEVDCSPM